MEYLLCLDYRPLSYEGLYTQIDISQIIMIFSNNIIGSGRCESKKTVGKVLEKDDVVYIGYPTIYNNISLIAKIIIGESLFSNKLFLLKNLPLTFLLVSSKFTNINSVSSINYALDSFFIKDDFFSKDIFNYLLRGGLVKIPKTLKSKIDGLKYTDSNEKFIKKVKELETLTLTNKYILSKKKNCFNNRLGFNSDSKNQKAFYEFSYTQLAHSFKKRIDFQSGIGFYRNKPIYKSIDDSTVKVFFTNEEKDLDFYFSAEAFPFFKEQVIGNNKIVHQFADNDMLFTEPLRSFNENFPLELRIKEDEKRSNTYYAPDGAIVGFDIDTNNILISFYELKASHTKDRDEIQLRLNGYLEQATKFLDVFNYESNFNYYKSNIYNPLDEKSIFKDSDIERMLKIRKINTIYKYSMLFSDVFMENILEKLSKNIILSKFNTTNKTTIRQLVKNEIADILLFSKGRRPEYYFISDFIEDIHIDSISKIAKEHNFIPRVVKMERFFKKGFDYFLYKFSWN